MRLIINSGGPQAIDDWRSNFQACAPGLEVVGWHEPVDPASIDYALVWEPDPGRLATFPNLKLIISAGAGATTSWPTRSGRATCHRPHDDRSHPDGNGRIRAHVGVDADPRHQAGCG